MPQKRRPVNRRKRKIRKRKPQRGNPYVLVCRGPDFMPDVFRTKIKYTERIPLTQISGSLYNYVFRGNSIFDPDFTGTGHQPVGHDQLAGIYSLYKVYACSFKVRYVSTVQTAGAVMELAICSTTNSTALSGADPELVSQQPNGQMRLVSGDGAAGQQIISGYMTTKRILGKSLTEGGSSTGSTFGSNPTYQWYWNICTQTVDESTTQNGYAYVELVYYVECTGRNILAES